MSRDNAMRVLRATGHYLGASVAVTLVALPVALEQAVEDVSFQDALGTLPVEMSLCHEGRSTLETGVLGDLHWDRTGAFGLGIRARVTEPPQAGGTLASYVDRRFVQANVAFIDRPDQAIATYAEEFRDRIVRDAALRAVAAGLVGGAVVLVLLRRRGPGGETRQHRRVVLAALLVGAVAASSGAAVLMFDRWACNQEPELGYAFPGVPELRFSSPQTLELARQIQPFIEKNTERIAERSAEFTATASSSFAESLERRLDQLRPRDGELLVLAEADPQGSYVGTEVRTDLTQQLLEAFEDVALRTISGDITSNGTVAEDDFVEAEAGVGGELPTVAVAGDHDSEATHDQMDAHGMVVPDLATEEVGGLRISGANDVEHKALFGTLVSNDSGLTEEELGARLREVVPEDEPGIVLLHQPDAAAGYLGVEDIDVVRDLAGTLTRPYDDGVPDVPPGTVNIGHLHDLDGPWVLWNTDDETNEVTWTVVDQLGTSGGAEERPTFNRFSTPMSVPLKPMSARLQYFDEETGLQTGFATVVCDVDGQCDVSGRTDVGLPFDRS